MCMTHAILNSKYGCTNCKNTFKFSRFPSMLTNFEEFTDGKIGKLIKIMNLSLNIILKEKC